MSVFGDAGTDDEEIKIPSCLSLFNDWKKCSSSQNQFRNYYIYGQFKNCEELQDNWTNCMAWKMKKSKQAKEAIIKYMKEMKEEKERKHTRNIWKFRKNPGEDWKS